MRVGRGLELLNVANPVPRGHQVLIRVEACGVCHTDVELREGKIGDIRIEQIGVRQPVTLGHEIAGVVEELGEEVEGLSRGQRVIVDWVSGDGSCIYCQSGEESMCDKARYLGLHLDGGYAEEVLIPHERHLFGFQALNPTDAAPLADSGVSAYSATRKARLSAEKSAVIVGLGGLGLMGVQFAAKVDGARVIAIGQREETLQSALGFGASEALNPSRVDVVKEVLRLTGGKGAEAVIDFVCSDQTLRTYPGALAKDGKYVMSGLFGGSLNILAPIMVLRNHSYIGSNYGKKELFPKVIELAESGKVKSVTTSIIRLEEVNRALDNLKEDKAVGRQVVTP